jgi:hypothetical protein
VHFCAAHASIDEGEPLVRAPHLTPERNRAGLLELVRPGSWIPHSPVKAEQHTTIVSVLLLPE